MTDEKHDPDDLPELPDHAELADLPEIPDLPVMSEEPLMTEETILAARTSESKPAAEEIPELSDDSTPGAQAADKTPDPDPVPASSAPTAEPKPESAPASIEPVEIAADAELTPIADEAPKSKDGKPPLRKLDKALTHLGVASKFVVLGGLLPFIYPDPNLGGAEGSVWFSLAAKLIVLAAAYLWAKQVLHNWGPKLPGMLGKLADLKLARKPKAKEDDKPAKRKPQKQTSIKHPFPTGLHLVSILLLVVAFMLALRDPRQSMLGPVGPAETGILAWAAFTYVHILAYERWGHFNPLMPLMFLAMLFSGFASVAGGFGAAGIWKVFHILGGLLVGGGGGLAAYTIVEAMMQAKKEGDVKKAAQIEARKAARASRRK